MISDMGILSMTAKTVGEILAGQDVDEHIVASFITKIYEALAECVTPEPVVAAPVPAYPIKKSITPDAIYSLEDGKPYKMLRKHLAKLGLTPEQYRAKWGLPADYPMTAPAYAERRSELAKKIGLGRKPAEDGNVAEIKPRGRSRKVAA